MEFNPKLDAALAALDQDMTDTRQAQLSGFDPVEFYLAMAEQLQELGF